MAQYVASTDVAGPYEMPKLITGDKLRLAVANQTFIKDGVESAVEAVKYDFHLGNRVLKAAFRQPKDINSIPEENRMVDPGEAVFVLTSERLDLPNDMIAILAPKRKLAHDGIIMLGGLAVDPLYKGHLLIGLYNFSTTPFPLLPGRKLIGAAFYQLEKSEITQTNSANPTEITDFPDELIRLIQNYRPVGLNGLEDQISETRRQLDALKNDLTTDKQWRDDFKVSLEKHDQQLGALIKLLEKEQEIRSGEDDKIRIKLESMSNLFFGLRMGWAAFAAIILLVIGALVSWAIPKMFG